MNALILISIGIITGLAVSKSNYSKAWDVVLGTIGTLAINAIIAVAGILYNSFSLLVLMVGSVFIIHIGRLLKNLSLS